MVTHGLGIAWTSWLPKETSVAPSGDSPSSKFREIARTALGGGYYHRFLVHHREIGQLTIRGGYK